MAKKRKITDKNNSDVSTNKKLKTVEEKSSPATAPSTKQSPAKKDGQLTQKRSKDTKGRRLLNHIKDDHRLCVIVLRFAGMESPPVLLLYNSDVLFQDEIVVKPKESEDDLRNKIKALIKQYLPTYSGDFEFVFAFWNILHLLNISEYRMNHLQNDRLYVRLSSPHPIPPRIYLRSGEDNMRFGPGKSNSVKAVQRDKSSFWQHAPDNIDPMQILNTKVDEHFSHFVGVPGLNNLAKSIATAAYFNWLEAVPLKHPGHIVLQGNPGTGKTTGARALANFLSEVGIVSGKIVEAYRDDLVDYCIGGTERKTNDVIRSGYGGVIILDEVYTLNKPSSPNDFGHEALTTIMKYMTEEGAPVFIFIGYKEFMTEFVHMNQGFQRRIKYTLELKDYEPSALADIARKKLSDMKRNYDKGIPFEDYFRQLSKEYLHLHNASAAVRLAEAAQAKTRLRLLKEPHKDRLANCKLITKKDFDDAFSEILKEAKSDSKDENYLHLFL